MLNMVVEDMRSKGISPRYLVTDHIGFYELTVFLDGEGNASESDFENAAKLAFDYIKNMGTIRFCMEATKEEVASFER